MPTNELGQILTDSAAEVLETMFFTTMEGEAESAESSSEPWISARLSFHGRPSGRFGVRAPMHTARKIAGNFLGAEEEALTEPQIGDVLCELSNMVCGSVLSRMEDKSRFELLHPELDLSPMGGRPNAPDACCTLGLEEGLLEVWLDLEHQT